LEAKEENEGKRKEGELKKKMGAKEDNFRPFLNLDHQNQDFLLQTDIQTNKQTEIPRVAPLCPKT